MANRTQKAAMKQKADAGKAERAAARAKEKAFGREAEKAKPAKPAKAPKAAKGKAGRRGGAKPTAAAAPAQPGFMERWRTARAERAAVRKADAERRAKERQAEAERRAKEKAAAEEKARAEEAARQAAAEAAEKERLKRERRDEAKAARAAAKEEAARGEAEKAAQAEARKEERRRQRQAERQAIEDRERRAAEEAEAEDRRREAAKAARKAAAARAAAAAEPEELEPEMEFQEGSTPVDPARALVPASKSKGRKASAASTSPASPVDAQAEKVAEELARRRSKPVVIVEDELPVPRIPKAKAKGDDEGNAEPLATGEAVVDERYRPDPPSPPPPGGLSIPEMFILVANQGSWDERAEKAKPGRLGGALAGAILLELLQRGRLLVQRDRFTVVGEPGGDEAVEAAVAKVRSIRERKGDLSTLAHQRRVAKWNRELLEPFKDRLAERGLVQHGHGRHLGLFYRSHVALLDQDAQERLQNKLRRAIAGGGTPEAASILLLGLLDASGLLASIVPDEAMDYNRKRLNGLLGGRDIMGYKVDPHLKGLQEVAVRTILQNVRTMASG